MRKFLILTITAIFSMALIGCETTPTNTNVRVNTNVNANANTIIVTNANTDMANTKADNDWEADLTEEEFEKDKSKYEERAKKYDDDTIGQGAQDLWIWTKTRASLATTDDLRDSTINVDVNNAVVTLKGTVASQAGIDKAVAAAKAIKGVKDVKNSLKVDKGDSMTNQATSDGDDKKANSNMANKK